MQLTHDYHTHTTYSDGRFIPDMINAAEEAGLEGIGFADHCNVSGQPSLRDRKTRYGFNLDLTYERRRTGIEAAREKTDIRVFDAVELDYHPADEERTRAFLDGADFDYALGSVHDVDDFDLASWSTFEEMTDEKRSEIVDRYFDLQVSLIESEIFDIVSHLDFIERNPRLRGYAKREQYVRVAEALAESRTIPELNGGSLQRDYGKTHPRPEFLDVLLNHDVEFTVGSDAHSPSQLRERIDLLSSAFDERELEPVTVVE